MWKKSLAMIAMLGICGGVYASEAYHIEQEVTPADRDLSTWEPLTSLDTAGSFTIKDIGKLPNSEARLKKLFRGLYPQDTNTFQDLDPEAYEAVLNSPEKWQEFVDRIKHNSSPKYMKCVDNYVVQTMPCVNGIVIEGEDWLQFNAAPEHAIGLDNLIKVPHLILSDGTENGPRILFNAKPGKPFRLKGSANLRKWEMDLSHSELESFTTKNIQPHAKP